MSTFEVSGSMTPDNLKAWRKTMGLSQSEAAAGLGLSLKHYQKLESGVSPIRTLHRLACAAYALGVR